MKPVASAAATADWTQQPERARLWPLRAMRWIALTAGRRVSRWLLPPIAVGYLAGSADLRLASRRYLTLALGRPAGVLDLYRHVHTFAATVLDRVYLLQERWDAFEIEASGVEAIMLPFTRGDGVLACGAHIGSFEALRMVGHDKGLKVAMIMYEDNARLINDALAAIAPQAELHTIALGRLDAMLVLARWLDAGGVAGMLADRTLAAGGAGAGTATRTGSSTGPTAVDARGSAQRSRRVVLPFLGRPARFADGPFRLAAVLRRKVVFMAGLYKGGNRYELRFAELADFSAAFGPGQRDAAVRQALERYVETLEALCREAPYNWFNFYDFWADAGDGDLESA